jgi:hypothetical protein
MEQCSRVIGELENFIWIIELWTRALLERDPSNRATPD